MCIGGVYLTGKYGSQLVPHRTAEVEIGASDGSVSGVIKPSNQVLGSRKDDGQRCPKKYADYEEPCNAAAHQIIRKNLSGLPVARTFLPLPPVFGAASL